MQAIVEGVKRLNCSGQGVVQRIIGAEEIRQVAYITTSASRTSIQHGQRKMLTLPVDSFLKTGAEGRGVGCDGSNYGIAKTRSSDAVLIPDLRTGFIDPFCEVRTLSFISSMCQANGDLLAADPRSILYKAQAYLAKLVKNGQFICAPELEFYLEETHQNKKDEIAAWFPDVEGSIYESGTPYDLYYGLRSKMSDTMVRLGMPVKYHHLECGSTNDGTQQQEVEFNFLSALAAADNVTMARYIIENMAVDAELKPVFSPKPYLEIKNGDEIVREALAGNGLHIHMYIADGEKSLFYSKDGQFQISELGRMSMGGLLTHGRALGAFSNPTEQSYKRLDPTHEAPVDLFYDLSNRTASIRVPDYAESFERRFEYRPTDASGNFYLALASIIMALADGIKSRIDPIENGFGPEPTGRRVRLPESVAQAGVALRADRKFLEKGKVFPREVIDNTVTALTGE